MSDTATPKPRQVFNDDWRKWIAENLILGGTVESMLPVLLEHGFDPTEAREEMAAASASPYTAGARRLINRLQKRDWILEIYQKLNRLLPNGDTVERKERLPRTMFLRDYYSRNRPVVITGAMHDWPALTKWTPTYLRERFGDRLVEVQVNRDADRHYEVNSQRHRNQMRFSDYIDRITASGPTNNYYMTANNNSRNFASLSELWDDIVQIPEYLDGSAEQRGFFWFGPAGTITPLHHDLTNNFMAQVYGRKQVKLIPACDLPYMANELHCFTDIDAEKVDWNRFPQYRNAQVIDVVIGPGDVLFLPVGWWHHVRALDVSITMSFTNFVFDNDFYSCYTTRQDV